MCLCAYWMLSATRSMPLVATGEEVCIRLKSAAPYHGTKENWLALSAGGYNEDFRGKMRSVLYNLKDEKNQDFRGKVLRGEVSPARICHMESHDMASEVQSH